MKVANNPGSCEEWYLGDETDGVRHGHGAAFFTSGDVYLGQVYQTIKYIVTAKTHGVVVVVVVLAVWAF